MTEPSPARPIPGPPRPGPGAVGSPEAAGTPGAAGTDFAGLAALPVAEHVAVFEEEHARLQRELATIDQL